MGWREKTSGAVTEVFTGSASSTIGFGSTGSGSTFFYLKQWGKVRIGGGYVRELVS